MYSADVIMSIGRTCILSVIIDSGVSGTTIYCWIRCNIVCVQCKVCFSISVTLQIGV